MLKVNGVEQVNLNLNLAILTIAVEVPEPLAERFDRILDTRTPLDEAIGLLSSFQIHKCFGNTVRVLMRAAEVRSYLERLQRKDDVVHLDAIVSRVLSELYAYKSLDLTGRVISSNTDTIQNLFADVCRLLWERTGQEDSENIIKELRALRIRFVEELVLMMRDRAADIRTTGLGSSDSDIEKRIHKLERQNFEDIVNDYVMFTSGGTDHKLPLPDIAYRRQTEIENSLRVKLRAEVSSFIGRDRNQPDKQRFFSRFRSRRHERQAPYVAETESFLVNVRIGISKSLQLLILRSALDKVHILYTALECISNSVQAAESRAKVEVAKLEESEANSEAATLRSRQDLISESIATAYDATARFSQDHAEREKGHEIALIATANHLKDLNEQFALLDQHNTECLVALSALANEMRVYQPTLVKEAGEQTAPHTSNMAARILDTLNRIDTSHERYIKATQKALAGSVSPLLT